MNLSVSNMYEFQCHCATSRKVAGLIPGGVTGFFHWHNPSGRTMALGSNQPLTEMRTRNISWEKRGPVRRADNLTTFMCPLSWNLGASASWNTQGLSRPVMGLLLRVSLFWYNYECINDKYYELCWQIILTLKLLMSYIYIYIYIYIWSAYSWCF